MPVYFQLLTTAIRRPMQKLKEKPVIGFKKIVRESAGKRFKPSTETSAHATRDRARQVTSTSIGEHPGKNIEMQASAVETTEQETAKDEEPAIEDLPVEQTKKASYREVKQQVGICESSFHVAHNGILGDIKDYHLPQEGGPNITQRSDSL